MQQMKKLVNPFHEAMNQLNGIIIADLDKIMTSKYIQFLRPDLGSF